MSSSKRQDSTLTCSSLSFFSTASPPIVAPSFLREANHFCETLYLRATPHFSFATSTMKGILSDRILGRELDGSASRYGNIRAIYGDKSWIKDLDIVNELDGHSGCVNALRYVLSMAVSNSH